MQTLFKIIKHISLASNFRRTCLPAFLNEKVNSRVCPARWTLYVWWLLKVTLWSYFLPSQSTTTTDATTFPLYRKIWMTLNQTLYRKSLTTAESFKWEESFNLLASLEKQSSKWWSPSSKFAYLVYGISRGSLGKMNSVSWCAESDTTCFVNSSSWPLLLVKLIENKNKLNTSYLSAYQMDLMRWKRILFLAWR